MSGGADDAGPPRLLRLRLPATSANLGPGFDTLALALAMYLEIEAAPSHQFAIHATGRNVELCSRLEDNLLLTVYRETVRRYSGRDALPLSLRMLNGIPLGMGCGSSAASPRAGVALATHYGDHGRSRDRILAEAAMLEGHPDNAAACWLGGFVASAWEPAEAGAPAGVAAVSLLPPEPWCALLALPRDPLPTEQSRAVLPSHYSRADAVLNLQALAVLTAAFAAGRGGLLASGAQDRLHQPYRGAVCPLLPPLLPLAGAGGILSVTLSGAGPAVLLLLADEAALEPASMLVKKTLAEGTAERTDVDSSRLAADLLFARLARGSAECAWM